MSITTNGDPNWIYRDILHTIITHGKICAPRGQRTAEVIGARYRFPNMRRTLITEKLRALNYRFAVAEFFWMMAGRNDVEALTRFNTKMAQFSDDGIKLAGAYGPRFLPQWDYCVQTLRQDPDSRQAVMTIWTPNPTPSKDVPCTVSFQFLNREDQLHLVVYMRSSDAWLGIPYDVFSFSNIGLVMAGELGLVPGGLTMMIGSSHLYERDWLSADALRRSVPDSPPVVNPEFGGRINDGWINQALKQQIETIDISVDAGWGRYARALACPTSMTALEVLLGKQ